MVIKLLVKMDLKSYDSDNKYVWSYSNTAY